MKQVSVREKTSYTEQVGEKILSDLQRGAFNSGDILPSLRTLAKEYGVSVGTVRRAVVKLTLEGVLGSRWGKGNYILDSSANTPGIRNQKIYFCMTCSNDMIDLG